MSRISFIIRFIPIYHITNKRPYILNLFFQIYMKMENDHKSGDVLSHFNGVSLFSYNMLYIKKKRQYTVLAKYTTIM
jgi:hypothetical protein